MSRFNEILHGDPATLEQAVVHGDLTTNELCAAISNLCGQIMRLEAELSKLRPVPNQSND